ncbi:hypothetical protein K458DRAFT_209716 [Lentithecium fluviatile CBS 122367]|uniref:Ricin B lectin domain-containing protein n=1 Tax=Lentithecium fluviatile CBS 122367 TaxID=1168545 RepID=A0A6G1J6S8_9PLEO|nr:hypothetical protein K458DRAFT_209716 [Lentithecium fluviatile CBS 122367]
MGAAKFDSKQWYHIYNRNDSTNALVGTSLFEGRKGATFFQPANLTEPYQKWQFYAVDESGTYMIRSKDGGPNGFLGAQYSPDDDETVVTMLRIDLADDTVSWTISPAEGKDGAYYLTNRANGTIWRFGSKGTKTIMDNSDPNPGQQLSFEPIAAIKDEAFDTLNLLSKTVSTPATSAKTFTTPSTSPTPAPTSSDPANPSPTTTPAPNSSGLSTPAIAAIGASLGGVALIALVVLGLFFWRRRKQSQTSYHQTNQDAYFPEEVPVSETDPYFKPELAADEDNTVKHASLYAKPELAANDEGRVHHQEGQGAIPELGTNETENSTSAWPLGQTSPSELPTETVRNELPERR